MGVEIAEHLIEAKGGEVGSGVPLLMGSGGCFFLHGAGLLASCDPGVGKGAGGGSEEQLHCPSRTLNPALLVILITNVLLICLFSWGLNLVVPP